MKLQVKLLLAAAMVAAVLPLAYGASANAAELASTTEAKSESVT